MELIDIIFKILIYGGVLLIVVIIASYLISRINRKENPQIEAVKKSIKLYSQQSIRSNEQSVLRKNNLQPIIFHVDQVKSRDLKILKKQTIVNEDSQENPRTKNINVVRKTQSSANRYKIINDEMRKENKPFIVNF